MHPCTMFRSVPGVLGWESGDSKLYFYGSITFLSTYKANSKGKFLCITLLWKQHISWKFRHTFIAMLEPLKPSVLDSHQHRPGFWPRWTSTPWPPWVRPLAAMQVSTQSPPSSEGSPTLSSHPLHTADFIFSSWLHTEILVRLCFATLCSLPSRRNWEQCEGKQDVFSVHWASLASSPRVLPFPNAAII